MTVQTTESTKYAVGNGITTNIPFTFLILDASHLEVYLDDVIQTAGFVININADQATSPGGSVDFTPAPGSGVAIALIRKVPLDQVVDYTDFDKFPAETHEGALDKLTLIDQQQQEQIDKSFRLPDTYSGSASAILPEPEAGKGVKWDATGENLVNTDLDPDETANEAAASAAAAAASASNAASSEAAAATSASDADLERQYAAEWANKPEDSLISADAGGDEVDDYSALHHANKAAASAASIPGDAASLSADQNWTGSQRSPFIVDNDLSFDMDAGQNFKGTPTGIATLDFSNIADGQSGALWLDNSGGHVISKGAAVLMDSELLTTISAAGVYILGYECDGTNVAVTSSQALG